MSHVRLGFWLASVLALAQVDSILAQDASPVPFPERRALLGLGEVDWPDSAADIATLFARLPSAVPGFHNDRLPPVKSSDNWVEVAYGHDPAQIPGRLVVYGVEVTSRS